MTDNTVWSHTFDFTRSEQGWVVDTGTFFNATYVPGVGWQVAYGTGTGGHNDAVVTIKKVLASTTYVASMKMYFSLSAYINDFADGTSNLGAFVSSVFHGFQETNPTGSSYDQTSPLNATVGQSVTTSDKLVAYFATNAFGTNTTLFTINKLVVTGLGPNPFLLDDGSECPCNFIGNDLDEASD